MAQNLASKYSTYVDEEFEKTSVLTGATNKNVEMSGVNEVKVYSFGTATMNDYTKSGTARYGTPAELDDTTQTFTISKDRSFTFTIDKGNNQDQLNLKEAAARLRVQQNQVVTPEIDEYVLGKWAYGAGKVVGGSAPASGTLLGLIQTGVTYMNNNFVPKQGRALFIAETYAAMLPQLSALTYLEGLGSTALTENKLPRVAGLDVHSVPDSIMPDNVYFIIQHKVACPFIQKLEDYKIHQDPPGINGNLVEGRVRYWADVLGNKANAVYVYANTSYVQAAPVIAEDVGTDGLVSVTASGATLYYTTDGSDPRYSSTRTLIASGGTFTLTATATVKAYGYTATKYPSTVASLEVEVSPLGA